MLSASVATACYLCLLLLLLMMMMMTMTNIMLGVNCCSNSLDVSSYDSFALAVVFA